MNRQTRLIIILAGMALVGIVALGLVADRYSRVIAARGDGSGQTSDQAARVADAQVDAFVRVRLALCDTIDAGSLDDMDPDARALAFAVQRDRQLAGERLHAADYRELRQHYRFWKKDQGLSSGVWKEAFDKRQGELSECDLGDLEALDR